MTDASVQIFAVALAAIWCGFGLYGLARMAARSPQGREMLERLRRSGPLGQAAALALLVTVVAIGGTKPGGGNQPRNTPNTRNGDPSVSSACSVVGEPRFGLVEVRTAGVAMRTEPTNAVEATAWRLRGASEDGIWIERERPFFALGTNPVRRVYASASGALSFESARHPPVGAALPDGTAVPSLAPFRASLGILPAANETNAAPSRFWHAPAPGGGLLLAWENVALDRLPDRRATIQAELKPNGDFRFLYDFPDAIDPPPTNFAIGAQAGTNAVNALYFGPLPEGAPGGAGRGSFSAPVWRVDGGASPPGEPQSIADLLCTNGALRTPARFALEWKNIAEIGNGDSDGDGLSDWDEVFVHGTDPRRADTDGDSLSDSSEVLAGADPLDADENNDGIPDGVDPAAWAADPLWAANATNGGTSITITLNAAILADASASLVVGDLCIPLRSPDSWTLALVPGELYAYRLHTSGAEADLSIAPATNAPPQRTGPPLRSVPAPFPFWTDDPDGVFDGPSDGGAGEMAVPTLELAWIDPGDGSHEDGGSVGLHEENAATFQYTILPSAINRIPDIIETTGFSRTANTVYLPVESGGGFVSGTITFRRTSLRWGNLFETRSAHRCWATYENPYCSGCGHYLPVDLLLSLTQNVLTLKHDNQVSISIQHGTPSGVTVSGASIRIRRLGETNWLELAAAESIEPWTARVAGYFELQGRLTIDGKDAYTEIENMEVQFPGYVDIISDSDVQRYMTTLWNETKQAAGVSNNIPYRQELGAWLFLDTGLDTYRRSQTFSGPIVYEGQTGYDMLPIRPPDSPSNPTPLATAVVYPVALFHTHTPMFYRPASVFRPTGPSPEDDSCHTSNQVPGIVYDYVPTHMVQGVPGVFGGTPLNSPARPYPSYGTQRRPTP